MPFGPRSRRYFSRRAIAILRRVGFRYDYARDAYVLVVIGDRWGPVLRERPS